MNEPETSIPQAVPTKIVNAVVEDAFFGRQDHGILTIQLNLEMPDGVNQTFGGYALDKPYRNPNGETVRMGTAFGCQFAIRVLDVFAVPHWGKLEGQFCRAKIDQASGKIISIGHIVRDRWFEPAKDPSLQHFLDPKGGAQ